MTRQNEILGVKKHFSASLFTIPLSHRTWASAFKGRRQMLERMLFGTFSLYLTINTCLIHDTMLCIVLLYETHEYTVWADSWVR